MKHEATATITGEIANKGALTPTSGGFLATSIKTFYPRTDDSQGVCYIQVKWFGDDAQQIAAHFKPGDVVTIKARIKTEKRGDAKWYSEYIAGESIKLAGTVGEPAEAFDATPMDAEDDIPF